MIFIGLNMIFRAVSLIGEEKVKDLQWFHPKEPSLKLDDKITKYDLEKDILKLYKAFVLLNNQPFCLTQQLHY